MSSLFANVNWKQILRRYGTPIGAIFVFIILSIIAPNFLTSRNLFTLLRQMSALTVISLGFTYVMAAGGFDMSVGNTIGLVNIIFAMILVGTESLLLALIVALLVGVVIGLVNGLLVVVVGLPDFIGTFSVGAIAYGIKMLMTEGSPIFIRIGSEAFDFIGRGFIGTVPFPVIIMIALMLLSVFILNKTTLGRKIYSIGDNPTAANFAGINITKNRMLTFVFSGIAVAIGAIIMTSRMGSGQPLAGEEYLLDVIAINFLSTTMFGEGEPTAKGTFVGALIIAMLNNGLTLLDVPYYFQDITQGVVVIGSVSLAVLLGQKLRINF